MIFMSDDKGHVCKAVRHIHFTKDNNAILVLEGADRKSVSVTLSNAPAYAVRSGVQQVVDKVVGNQDIPADLETATTRELLEELRKRFPVAVFSTINHQSEFNFVLWGGGITCLGLLDKTHFMVQHGAVVQLPDGEARAAVHDEDDEDEDDEDETSTH